MTVYSNGEETTGFVDSNSEYFNLINAARIKEYYNRRRIQYRYVLTGHGQKLLQIISDEVQNYKESYKLVDFTDMIEKFNVSKLCPNLT